MCGLFSTLQCVSWCFISLPSQPDLPPSVCFPSFLNSLGILLAVSPGLFGKEGGSDRQPTWQWCWLLFKELSLEVWLLGMLSTPQNPALSRWFPTDFDQRAAYAVNMKRVEWPRSLRANEEQWSLDLGHSHVDTYFDTPFGKPSKSPGL